jgi:uncharacterized membrane protein YkoI
MKFALPLIFLFAVTLSMSVSAQGSLVSAITTIKTNQQAKQQLRVKSNQQAAQMAKSRFGGKVLKVQKKKSGYRVKLIKTDGHIVSVYVDAKTGRISGG